MVPEPVRIEDIGFFYGDTGARNWSPAARALNERLLNKLFAVRSRHLDDPVLHYGDFNTTPLDSPQLHSADRWINRGVRWAPDDIVVPTWRRHEGDGVARRLVAESPIDFVLATPAACRQILDV